MFDCPRLLILLCVAGGFWLPVTVWAEETPPPPPFDDVFPPCEVPEPVLSV